jgi:hypothetical protein
MYQVQFCTIVVGNGMPALGHLRRFFTEVYRYQDFGVLGHGDTPP